MLYKDQTDTPRKLSIARILLACWLAAVFMIYPAIPYLPYACAIVILFLGCAFRVNKHGFALTVVLTAIACVSVASVVAVAHVLSVISVAVIGCVMLREKASAITFMIFTAVIYGVAAFVKTPMEALSVLTPIPIAIALAICAKLRTRRVSTICVISAIFIATLLAPAVISFCIEHGADASEQFKQILSEVRQAIIDFFVKANNELPTEAKEMLPAEITESDIATIIDVFFPLIPALFVIASNIFAFIVHTLSLWTRFAFDDLPTADETVFEMSKVSAWLYIISFVAMLFSFSSSELAEICMIAFQSLNLILTPSFLFAGICAVSTAFRMAGGKKKWFHGVLAVLAVMYCSAFLVYPLVAIGVMGTIRSNRIPPSADSDPS